MSTGNLTDRRIIAGIIAQLSDLSERLPSENDTGSGAYGMQDSSFFFNFELNSSAEHKDYRKYHDFMDRVTFVLNDYGIHIGSNGYSYLVEAVKIMADRGRYDVRMKTDIYPRIAEKYRIRNQGAVEHSIRNAINAAYDDYVRNPACNRMGVFGVKPKNKQFIIHVADRVLKSIYESLTETAG